MQSEAELRIKAEKELEQKRKELTDAKIEYQQSLSRIEEQSKLLREIASIHSHNVRGPLATIMGLASMFNEKNISDPDNVLIIEGIKIASERLDKILTEIVQKSWSVELMRERELLMVR